MDAVTLTHRFVNTRAYFVTSDDFVFILLVSFITLLMQSVELHANITDHLRARERVCLSPVCNWTSYATYESTGVPCNSDKMKANASLNAIALNDASAYAAFRLHAWKNDSTQNQFVRKLSRRLFSSRNCFFLMRWVKVYPSTNWHKYFDSFDFILSFGYLIWYALLFKTKNKSLWLLSETK